MTEPSIIDVEPGVSLIVKESLDTFYFLINGTVLVPFSIDESNPYLDELLLEEAEFKQGKWKMKRRLNGDEVAYMCYTKQTLQKMKLFTYH